MGLGSMYRKTYQSACPYETSRSGLWPNRFVGLSSSLHNSRCFAAFNKEILNDSKSKGRHTACRRKRSAILCRKAGTLSFISFIIDLGKPTLRTGNKQIMECGIAENPAHGLEDYIFFTHGILKIFIDNSDNPIGTALVSP